MFRGVTTNLSDCVAHVSNQGFDPASESYGHKKAEDAKYTNPVFDVKAIPHVPAVQLIGNGTVINHEGIVQAVLKHPSHTKSHKTPLSAEDEATGTTRFCRWHMDAALYDLSPPRVTSLYGLVIPKGAPQVFRYDDGTGDELPVPLAATVFVSGHTMFDILPAPLKSLAVRAKVKYAPHMYVWMSSAHILPTGLGIESEGLEVPLRKLPEWDDARCKTLPVVGVFRCVLMKSVY